MKKNTQLIFKNLLTSFGLIINSQANMQKVKKSIQIFISIAWFGLFITCGDSGKLESIIEKPNTLAIIKETKGFYWVIPGKGIEKFDNNQITLKENTLITYGKGEGDINKIVEYLVDHRETQSGSFQSMGGEVSETINGKKVTTRFSDCFTGLTTEKITLTIKDIVEIKTGKFREAD